MRLSVLLALLWGCPLPQEGGDPTTPTSDIGWTQAATLEGPALAAAEDAGTLWVSTLLEGERPALLSRTGGGPWKEEGALPGVTRWLGVLPGGTRLAWVDDLGLLRAETDTWNAVGPLPGNAFIDLLSPIYTPVPFDLYGLTEPGHALLAAAGGLYRTADDGQTWETVQIPATVGINLLFNGLGGHGEHVVALATKPAALLPDQFSDALRGTVFTSLDGGTTWTNLDPEGRFLYPTDACVGTDGSVYLATMDQGAWHYDGQQWSALEGPTDLVAITCDEQTIGLGSASRGAWWLSGQELLTLHPPQDATLDAVRWLSKEHVLLADGRAYERGEDTRVPASPAQGATVYVALSHHVNLYHSYRGDERTDQGYGIDLEVIDASLDWLEEHPDVHADWDIENHFSLDGWFVTDPVGAEVLGRLAPRITSGQDGLRLMSWNNGAVAHHRRDEFDEAISRAIPSYEAAFGPGPWRLGVQPQENMFTPEHLDWYRDAGVEWITLFYSGTPFGALRSELGPLPKDHLYTPLTLTDPMGDGAMTLVPTYHHGDLLNHGGLRGWVEQIHGAWQGDRLLVVHFDADAESWENFGGELDQLSDLPYVRYTTIQDFLDTHEVAPYSVSVQDTADGSGNGFSSWAEKNINAEVFTDIHRSRDIADAAKIAGEGLAEVEDQLAESFEARLVGLSTTHFGLAVPELHPDREAAARAYGEQALSAAYAALDAAPAPAAGTLEVISVGSEATQGWVELSLEVPADAWPGTLRISDDAGNTYPHMMTAEGVDPVQLSGRAWLPLQPGGVSTLTWAIDPVDSTEPTVTAESWVEPDWDSMPLATPYTVCDGERVEAVLTEETTHEQIGHGSTDRSAERIFDLPLCDAPGTLTMTARQTAGATWLDVSWSLGDGDTTDAWSAVPVAVQSPLEERIETITWQTFGGRLATRHVPRHRGAWNGQAIDGWFDLGFSTESWRFSHDVSVRTNMGPASLRTQANQPDELAFLGARWATPDRHRVRETGGHGFGDVATSVVGSQFAPSAPDWGGQTIALRVAFGPTDDFSTANAALFAHPPVVRVGAYLAR